MPPDKITPLSVHGPGQTRALFPRGLVQPAASFRFAADALLLAAFARKQGARPALDLGAGCGVVAFGLALRFAELPCLGLEREAALLDAARANALALGLDGRVSFVEGDLTDNALLERLGQASYGLVTANPPYHTEHSGRAPRSAVRQRAVQGPPELLAAFARAASFLLCHHGRFACILPPTRLLELCLLLREAGLEPRRIRAVHARPGEQARRILLEARKNARPDMQMEAPLVLYAAQTGTELNQAALDFCPWLKK